MTPAQLAKLTVKQLREISKARGLNAYQRHGKRLLKADLVAQLATRRTIAKALPTEAELIAKEFRSLSWRNDELIRAMDRYSRNPRNNVAGRIIDKWTAIATDNCRKRMYAN